MKKIELEELKQLQLNILDSIAEYCEQNNINYWLEFGSLIGAVRHKGYIPWDDDIDIGMLREDYIKFSSSFNDYNNRYQLHDMNNDKDYSLLFGKVYDTCTIEKDPNMLSDSCVNVDIFVFDNISDDTNKQKKLFKTRDFYRKLNNLQTINILSGNFCKKYLRIILRKFLKFFPKNYFNQKYMEILLKNKDSTFVGNYCGYSKYVFKKSEVKETKKVPFEDRFYRIPIGYDEILTKCYGNYMELPPVEKRVNPHKNIEIYFLDEE